jgi:hypothetical protein
MAKRDYISEILSRNRRLHRRSNRWVLASKRFGLLGDCFQFLLDASAGPKFIRQELFRYLPVAHVAALEGFFRIAYAELINFGDPYLQNAANFKELKFTIDPILGIHRGVTTTGDLIAHLLPHNSPSDISNNISVLLGSDFKKALEAEFYTPPNSKVEFSMKELGPPLWEGLYRLFEMRHIICHELATKANFKLTEIKDVCQRSIVFIIVVDCFLTKILDHPENPTMPLHPSSG